MDLHEKYSIKLLHEAEIVILSQYIKEHPYLWDTVRCHYHCLTFAVTYEDYMFSCTQESGKFSTIIIWKNGKIIETAKCRFKNGADYGIIGTTGNAEIDEMITEISIFCPFISEECFYWLVHDYLKIESEEYDDEYEEGRCKIIDYEKEMVNKYLADIKEIYMEFLKSSGDEIREYFSNTT